MLRGKKNTAGLFRNSLIETKELVLANQNYNVFFLFQCKNLILIKSKSERGKHDFKKFTL
jgi:hypothetical protein